MSVFSKETKRSLSDLLYRGENQGPEGYVTSPKHTAEATSCEKVLSQKELGESAG